MSKPIPYIFSQLESAKLPTDLLYLVRLTCAYFHTGVYRAHHMIKPVDCASSDASRRRIIQNLLEYSCSCSFHYHTGTSAEPVAGTANVEFKPKHIPNRLVFLVIFDLVKGGCFSGDYH